MSAKSGALRNVLANSEDIPAVRKLLIERVIVEARKLEYARIRLEAERSMDKAIWLFKSLGFFEIASSVANPNSIGVCLEKSLKK